MPSFRWLAKEELDPLIDYVILLSYRGELETRLPREFEYEDELFPEVIVETALLVHRFWEDASQKLVLPDTPQPPYSAETIESGRQMFLSQQNECWKCHGRDGRGQTIWLSPKFIAEREALPESERVLINRDIWGNIAPAADLTAGMLHGGRRPIDIYRRIYAGINGTPMPGFATKFTGEDREKIWHLAHFVISLTEGQKFEELEDSGSGTGSSE